MLLTEAAEGGAGVLGRLVDEPDALARVARKHWTIIHYDPDTGEDLGHAPGARERCEKGCYDCLLSYAQPVRAHQHRPALDRRAAAASSCRDRSPQAPADATAAEQQDWLNKLRDSELEKRYVDWLTSQRLPAARRRAAHRRRRPRPRRTSSTCCRATRSRCSSTARTTTTPSQQLRDDDAAERLEDLGWTVVRLRHDDDWTAHAAAVRLAVTAPERPPRDARCASPEFAVGSLVRARGREWVVLPGSQPDFLLLQPLGGGCGGHRRRASRTRASSRLPSRRPASTTSATPPPPTCCAPRCASASPVPPARSARLAGISVSPRSYQYVPLAHGPAPGRRPAAHRRRRRHRQDRRGRA